MNREETIRAAARLRGEGQGEEALRLLKALAEHAEEDAELQYQLAWTHDSLGLEREAVPHYERALSLGLAEPGDDAGARLGLGSTLRTLGRYAEARQLLEASAQRYPERAEFRVFLAMALYNEGEAARAMELLLRELADSSSAAGVRDYAPAIRFYADKLDQVW
ncbi:tetratricopeptide repeat protein [Paenibacillus sp. FSL W8-1187]|uniref:TPR repeat protein n=1 Tax=Paenibacillus pasadenensis TaxID=217090 RepID=A0A2N5N7V9_9BACL|nr:MULTISPECIES: tetratricopeptide repeat protein [Paenibacillus]PLT46431.1 TPR repeat protein [Paenibacillus pasadenensis]QGG56860.1 tetratricopeptide repeat protein [Paenibacillus sp. B01]